MFKLMLVDSFKKHNQNKLFGQTRWRLAIWYAGIMGAILVLCGLGIYQALTYAPPFNYYSRTRISS